MESVHGGSAYGADVFVDGLACPPLLTQEGYHDGAGGQARLGTRWDVRRATHRDGIALVTSHVHDVCGSPCPRR